MGTATDVETAQYLTFRLDRELFAVDIAKVREVLELTTTPAVYRGLSLRPTPGISHCIDPV